MGLRSGVHPSYTCSSPKVKWKCPHMRWLHSDEQSCTSRESSDAHNRANPGKAGRCESDIQAGCQQWVLATKVEREVKAANHVYHSMRPVLLYASTIWNFFRPRTFPTEHAKNPGRPTWGRMSDGRHHCVRGKSSRAWRKARGGPS